VCSAEARGELGLGRVPDRGRCVEDSVELGRDGELAAELVVVAGSDGAFELDGDRAPFELVLGRDIARLDRSERRPR
jgi:hypothetical protein